jgi:ABC-type sugar transport system permease subunit
VPGEIVEAARTDGAGRWSITRHVKLHYIRSTAIIAVLLMVIANFNNFPHIESMTGGGPGVSTTTLVIYVYQLAFSSYDVGYASAVGVVWLVILVILAVGFVRAVRMEGAR